jgi:putative redox protein
MNEIRVKLPIKEGFRTQITAGAHTIIADEPKGAGGGDEGPSPYQLLLAALGACTAMTLKMYVERKKLPITEIEVLLTFDRIHIDDCESCVKEERLNSQEVQQISRLIYVTGDVTEEQKERLLYIAGRCPVHVTLHSNPHVEDALIVRKASR